MMKNNVVVWFEIPVLDMERAMGFYEAVFGLEFLRQQMGPADMAWFPWVETGPGAPGALICYPDDYQPSTAGTLVYFTAPSGDLSVELGRVEAAGGRVVEEKRMISEEIGFMAVVIDSEGNRIALHSQV